MRRWMDMNNNKQWMFQSQRIGIILTISPISVWTVSTTSVVSLVWRSTSSSTPSISVFFLHFPLKQYLHISKLCTYPNQDITTNSFELLPPCECEGVILINENFMKFWFRITILHFLSMTFFFYFDWAIVQSNYDF